MSEGNIDIVDYASFLSVVSTTIAAGGTATTQADLLINQARAIHYFILLGAVNGGSQLQAKMQSSAFSPLSWSDIPGATSDTISPVASTKYSVVFRASRLPAGQAWCRMVLSAIGGTSIVVTGCWQVNVGYPRAPMENLHVTSFNTGVLDDDTNGNARLMLNF